MPNDFWGQETKKQQFKHEYNFKQKQAELNHQLELAKIAAQKDEPERQAALIKTRSENFDTELTLIAEANKPKLEELAVIERRNKAFVKISIFVIILGFILALAKL